MNRYVPLLEAAIGRMQRQTLLERMAVYKAARSSLEAFFDGEEVSEEQKIKISFLLDSAIEQIEIRYIAEQKNAA